MSLAAIPGLDVTELSAVVHRARVFGPRPGVHNGSASDPANLFVVDARQHPFGVGAGLPEPPGLDAAARRSPYFRGTDYGAADQARLSAAMVDQFGDGSLMHGHYAWGPNFYGSGPPFAMVGPEAAPWTVVTYLQALVGDGAEREPNLRLSLEAPAPVPLRAVCEAVMAARDLPAAILVGVVRSAYLSTRDWIKPAVYGERYGLKMDEYRTRITISNPTHQFVVTYLERGQAGLALHTHAGALWGEAPERLFAYHPAEPGLILDGPCRMKALCHLNHHPQRPEEDSTITRATLYLYAAPTVERIMD